MNSEPGMEKNYFLALFLCMLVLIGYPMLMRKLYPPPPPSQEEVLEVPAAAHSQIAAEQVLSQVEGPSITKAIPPALIPYQNQEYQAMFSTMGGTLVHLEYRGELGTEELTNTVFFEEPSEMAPGIFGVRFLHDKVDLSRANFKLNRKGKNQEIFEFIYEKPGEYRLKKEFILSGAEPIIALDLTVENLSQREKHFPIEIIYGQNVEDASGQHAYEYQSVALGEKVLSADFNKVKKKGFDINTEVQWAGLIKKYFALLIKPDWKSIAAESKVKEDVMWGLIRMEPLTVAPGLGETRQLFIYAGPQRYEVLQAYEVGFERVLARGFFGFFKIALLKSLKYCDKFTHNFGWAIIVMTLIIKLAFAPLTHMSYKSMEKMKAVQPKLKALQEQHKSDPQKLNKEMMELYKRHKVNPMGGCFPMLLQIPVFIAFYQVLNEAIELKGAPFIWWMTDLAQPDRLFMFPFNIPLIGDSLNILPILMIGSMFWQQKLTPQAGVSPEQQKIFAFMPLIFGFIFYKMPSGLVLYWFINNILSIVQQVFVKRLSSSLIHHGDHPKE